MVYIGIDPGVTGAMAGIITPAGAAPTVQVVRDLPVITRTFGKGNELDVIELDRMLGWAQIMQGDAFVILEQAAPMNKGAKPGVMSAWRSGELNGALRALLRLRGIRHHLVLPATWKRCMGLLGKDKDASRSRAIEMFPACTEHLARKKDHNRAEAILLAEYGRRMVLKGEL